VNRGIAYRQGGKYDLAIADFSQVISRVPDNVNAYGGRAIAYLFQDRFDASIADYTTLIRLQPNNADHYANRCVVLARVGRFEDGLRDCQQALQFFPDDLGALESRGYVYLKSAQYALAVADYDTLSEWPGRLMPYGRGLQGCRRATAGGNADWKPPDASIP
jgi:tetratricopeptide (TPR) repeat protein